MKKVVVTITGVIFLVILSSETGKLLPATSRESDTWTRGSLQGLPDSPSTLVYRISGTIAHEDGSCLVVWFECRNRHQKGDCLNLQIDLYLYSTLIRGDRTIAKRINFNP